MIKAKTFSSSKLKNQLAFCPGHSLSKEKLILTQQVVDNIGSAYKTPTRPTIQNPNTPLTTTNNTQPR